MANIDSKIKRFEDEDKAYLDRVNTLNEIKKNFADKLKLYGDYIFNIFDKAYYEAKKSYGDSKDRTPIFKLTLIKARNHFQYSAVAEFIQKEQAKGNNKYDPVIDLLIEIDEKYKYLLPKKTEEPKKGFFKRLFYKK